MSFQYQLTVRFGQIDAAGIVYFARLYDYCHIAYEEMLTQLGWPLAQILGNSSWAFPLVHSEADNKRPIYLGDTLDIGIAVTQLGRSSATFAYTLMRGQELCATAQFVHSCVSLPAFTSQALPQDFRQALSSLSA